MSDNNYNIEKGIPVPSKGKGQSTWKHLALNMEVGDSVLVNGRLEAMKLRNAIVRLGFRCVTRGNDKPQPRVWKVVK
jgi:hypothetical protein